MAGWPPLLLLSFVFEVLCCGLFAETILYIRRNIEYKTRPDR
tara:strand:+ start:838 stop:963 length:126 start_codon:yes stop_codon:yes gene_type:complete